MDPAAMTAPSTFELTKVVVRALPSNDTWLPGTKLLPFTTSGCAGEPTSTLAGEIDVRTGVGFSIESGCEPDVPPPGAAFVTSMEAIPVETGVVTAVSCDELTNVVASGAPPSRTTLVMTKLDPVTVSVEGTPTRMVDGERLPIEGTGFWTVSVTLVEVPPPGIGLSSVIAWVPAVAMSAAGTVAEIAVGPNPVVARGVASSRIVVAATQPVPSAVSVKVEPATTAGGLIEPSVGAGLVTTSVSPPDVPPAGVGFLTVIVWFTAVPTTPDGIVALT